MRIDDDAKGFTLDSEGRRVQIFGPGTHCRAGCKTQNHATWGECLRDAGVRTYLASPSRGLDGTAQKKWDHELDLYRQARREGIQPEGTTLNKVTEAMRLSDAAGAAYGRDFSKATPVSEEV